VASDPTKSVNLSLLSYDATSQTMRVRALLKITIVPKIDETRLKAMITRKTPDEALSYLKSLSEVENAQIKLWPRWVKRLPTVNSIRIKSTT